MSLRSKPLEHITEQDLQALVETGAREDHDIEYKRAVPKTRKERIDFLAAVSSFANASGGDLLLGIRAERGVAKELVGLDTTDADATILTLDNLIRDGIKPRATGIQLRPMQSSTSKIVAIVRIPRSWAAPHVVDYDGHWKFYARGAAGKYPLDITQVRAAFRLSEGTAEKIRAFRIDRVSRIASEETPVPVPLVDGPKFILHMIPFGAFDIGQRFDLSRLPDKPDANAGIYDYRDHRFNLDGLLIYNLSADLRSNAYSQFYTNGTVETVLRLPAQESTKRFEVVAFEDHLLRQVVPKLRSMQERLGVAPPVVVMMSILGASGYVVWPYSQRGPHHPVHGIDKDPLLIPETTVENFEEAPAAFMRPIFNAIWNSAGWSHAMTYDDSGTWTGKWPK